MISNDKKIYILKLANFLHSNSKVMSGHELIEHFNRNGIQTEAGNNFLPGRGIYTVIKHTHDYFFFELGLPVEADKIAKSFVNESGSHPWDT